MKRIYLDNAATSWPKPEAVYAIVDRYQRRRRAEMIRLIATNPHLIAVRLSSPAFTERWLAELDQGRRP